MKKVFGTKEWAKYSANVTIGCSNNCTYCYARDAYYKKGNTEDWSNERTDEKRLNYKWDTKDGVVMFPTQHDITENNISDCLIVLKNLLSAENKVLIVSKPRLSVIKVLLTELEEYKDQILFRFTIGSSDNTILKTWEPGASRFEERLACLKTAYEAGFETSVSMEPYLELSTLDLFRTVAIMDQYVTNSIWIGKMNKIDDRVDGVPDGYIKLYKEMLKDSVVKTIYENLKYNNKVKWKESIKKVVGLEEVLEPGLDI
jgi:DNA repair photolyase